MKIIIIDHEPYTYRKRHHYFMDEFEREGYSVEFWSLWSVFRYSKKLVYPNAENAENVYYLNTFQELKRKISNLVANDTFVFVEGWFNSESWTLYKYLNQYSIKWGRIEYFENPVSNFYYPKKELKIEVGKISSAFKNWYKAFNIPYLQFHYLNRRNAHYLHRIMMPSLIFKTGNFDADSQSNIKINSIDYFDVTTFNVEKLKPRYLDYRYIIFADIYLGKHPDLAIEGKEPYIDLIEYYAMLDKFFSILESEFNMPVVIAAHPKSNYSNEFGDRKVIKDNSANLIINSDLFLHHGSLSITYALLSGKKIIQFYDNSFYKNSKLETFVEIMNNIQDQINCININVDNFQSIKNICNQDVDLSAYDSVLNKFFKKESDLDNFGIVKENINSLFD